MSFMKHELAIDLGTANTVIYQNDKVVLDEPSIVAIQSRTGNLMAIGRQAQLMEGRENPGIVTIRPLVSGVIADFNAAELMIKGFIQKASGAHSKLFTPSYKLVIGIPKGSTPVEIKAVRDSSEHAGGREVYLVYEPMASALGIGLNVLDPQGNMIVDIGGGTTEIAVISLGGIVASNSIRVAGNEITKDIAEYLSRQHGVKVGLPPAEQIKFKVGSVLQELPADVEVPEPYVIRGKNIVTAHPVESEVTYQEIAHCIDGTVHKIEEGIQQVLNQTPPELYSDIVENGIWLAGGGALLRGIAQRFTDATGITFHVAEDPLKAVGRGACAALKHVSHYPFLMR